jgi:hypothetical protein
MELQGNIRVFARCRPTIALDVVSPTTTAAVASSSSGEDSSKVLEGALEAAAAASPMEVVAYDGERGVAERGFGEAVVVRDCRGYDTKQVRKFAYLLL